MDTKGWPQRSVEDAHNEIALKGAHQVFIETGSQNIAMIRRYIPHRELTIKEIVIGVRSKTKIPILYLKDVASEDVLKELETRIQNIRKRKLNYVSLQLLSLTTRICSTT